MKLDSQFKKPTQEYLIYSSWGRPPKTFGVLCPPTHRSLSKYVRKFFEIRSFTFNFFFQKISQNFKEISGDFRNFLKF